MPRFQTRKKKVKEIDLDNEVAETIDYKTLREEEVKQNSLSLVEVRNMQQIAETVVNNQFNQLLNSLSDKEIQVAGMIAHGEKDIDIVKQAQVSLTDIKFMRQKPAFMQEIVKIQYAETYSNENVLLQGMSKVQSLLLDKIVNGDMSEVSQSDAIKLFSANAMNINKITKKDDGKKSIDITLIMKELGINESLKEKNGMQIIPSKYPTINGITNEIESWDEKQ